MRTSDIGDSIHDKTFFVVRVRCDLDCNATPLGDADPFIAISIVIILYFNAIPLGERRSYSKQVV